jgi:hypothetical protein
LSSIGICLINTINNFLNITLNISIRSNSSNLIQIFSVKNSFNTLKSSTFQIYTYYDGLNALVDYINNSLIVTADPNPILYANVSSSNYAIKSVSTYTFSINFTNPVLSGTVLNISFPLSINIINLNIGYNIDNKLNCQLSKNNQNIILSSCFTNNTIQNINIILDYIQNPLSTKPT